MGYPSLVARPITEALASIAGLYTAVETYNPVDPADRWRRHVPEELVHANTLAVMEPGRGYWILVTENCTWLAPQ